MLWHVWSGYHVRIAEAGVMQDFFTSFNRILIYGILYGRAKAGSVRSQLSFVQPEH